MKKVIILCLTILMMLSFGALAGARMLKVRMDTGPVSQDPQVQLSGGMLQLSHMIFDPLVRWNKETQFDARLAESWERLDKYTVRFNLRQGVKFHSGNDFTAKDVAWTFNRLKSSPDFKGLFQPFKELRVVDDHTIELVTEKPYPLVLHMATYIFPMDSEYYTGTDDKGNPKDMLKKHADTYASINASGTGPFVVAKRQQGVRVDFERFDGYWDKSSPGNVDKIVMTPIKENPTRVAAHFRLGGHISICPI